MLSTVSLIVLGLLSTPMSIVALGPVPVIVGRQLLPTSLPPISIPTVSIPTVLPSTSISTPLPIPTSPGPLPVNLGTAGNFVILAQSGIAFVPTSAIVGNLGLSPAAASFITGAAQTKSADGTFSTTPQVVGEAFASDYASPTPATLDTAIADFGTAFNDASTRPNPDQLNVGAGSIGGLTLTPGLYKWTTGVTIATSVTIFGTALDTWIFQVGGTLSTSAAAQVILAGGALPQNIVWVVTGAVSTGVSSSFQGIILASKAVTLSAGTAMTGRILSQTQATIQSSSVVQP
ncbi:hypothetical protein K439DRAFT_703173 [Ramaria rubella]|nr:hypothetical protein K439DRAFT_703173 [Ramaria rubella]